MSDAPALPRSLVTLMTRLIDYAGLFPPAGLPMPDAVRRFQAYRVSADAWALGRFIVPAGGLDDLERALDGVGEDAGTGWELSVLAGAPVEADAERIATFAGRRTAGRPQGARVVSVEIKAASPEEIAGACGRLPRGVEAFFEVPWGADIEDLCAAARAAGQGIKLRTGGIAADAIPSAMQVARALAACASAGVPFKATAGLHHPFRSTRPLTYARSAPTAMMHGFLNVFVAAILLWAGQADVAVATRVLEDEMTAGFRFEDDALSWRGCRVGVDRVAEARHFARGFGSCSFDEPLSEAASAVGAR